MGGDVVLRDNGSATGDVALSSTVDTTAGFAGDSSFSGIASSAVAVASVLPEVIVAIEGDAQVASVLPEAIVYIEGDARVASALPEVVFYFPPGDTYTPAPGPGGGGGGGYNRPTCTVARPAQGYSRPVCTVYRPGSAFNRPYSGGSGGGGPSVQLAFAKGTADAVVLCTRARSGFYPTDSLSAFSWVRVSTFNGPGVVPLLDAEDTTRGWRFAAAGAGSPANLSWQYRDTSAAIRQDVHTYSGGDLRTAGWVSGGGFRSEGAPYTLRAFVDQEVGGSTAGTVAPQTGQTNLVTLFGAADGSGYITGQIIAPVLIGEDLGSDGSTTYQDAYYADAATRQNTAIFENPELILAPRARSSVRIGDPVELWAIDDNSSRVVGPTVIGTPGLWRGPDYGLSFSDLHYLTVPWVSTSLATGKTIIVSAQGSTIPSTTPACLVGRASGAGGGIQISIRNTDGVSAVFKAYDAGGAEVLSLTVASTAILGQAVYYVFRIGVGGTASCTALTVGPAGIIQNSASGTPSAAIALSDQRWGRNQNANECYSFGFGHRWYEAPVILSDTEVAEVITGTYGGVLSRTMAGVDSNIIDDADQQILWGYYDSTGAYGSLITFESVGTQVVPGS